MSNSELANIRLLVLDFDGVLTDNRVWVFEDGREAVACNRSDGLGLSLLKRGHIDVIVLSTETNPVVSARCQKLGLDCFQGLQDKAVVLQDLVAERGLDMSQVAYVGNDVNDLECLHLAGYSIVVADAHPTMFDEADLVLNKKGGQGAVRELCDMLLAQIRKGDN